MARCCSPPPLPPARLPAAPQSIICPPAPYFIISHLCLPLVFTVLEACTPLVFCVPLFLRTDGRAGAGCFAFEWKARL